MSELLGARAEIADVQQKDRFHVDRIQLSNQA